MTEYVVPKSIPTANGFIRNSCIQVLVMDFCSVTGTGVELLHQKRLTLFSRR